MKPGFDGMGGRLLSLGGLLMMVSGHSWLDCIGLADVEYKGPVQFFSDDFYKYCIGFGRGFPGRANIDINTIYTVQIDGRGAPNKATTQVCGTQTQVTENYPGRFNMAQVAPGTKLKFWYEMDNHGSRPTTVYLWGHKVPNKEIKYYSELDESKTLITTHPFATPDNCIDMNYPNTFCWGFWTVPEDWNGKYSLLWNWRWDNNPIGEEYNTCFEINVVGSGGNLKQLKNTHKMPLKISEGSHRNSTSTS